MKRESQLVVGRGVIGLTLDDSLKYHGGAIGISSRYLQLRAAEQSLGVFRTGCQDFVIELARFIEPVLLDLKLDVILLDLNIIGMLLVEGNVFGGGFVQITVVR